MYQIRMSFNNLWSYCSKEQFHSPLATSLANGLVICVYNSGLRYTLANLLEKCNLELHNKSLDQWYKMDKERIVKGDYATREERKKSTKTKEKKTNHPAWCISEIRPFNINHKDFIVIQKVFIFFIHKLHIAMSVYKKIISINKT